MFANVVVFTEPQDSDGNYDVRRCTGANLVMCNVQLLQEMTRNLEQLKTELETTRAQLERANRSLEVVRAESRERAQLIAGLQKEVRRLEDRKNVLEYRCKSVVYYVDYTYILLYLPTTFVHQITFRAHKHICRCKFVVALTFSRSL